MRLTDLLDKEHSFRYLVGFVLALLFFGGVWVPPYCFKRSFDEEMNRIYRIVNDFVHTGTSEDRQYRAKGTIVPLF